MGSPPWTGPRVETRYRFVGRKVGGYRFPLPAQADGCFRTSASARIRIESAGVFAVAALFSNEGASPFSFAMLLTLMCDFSALLIAFCSLAIRPSGRACDRDNWSTYAFATTNLAGHSIFCWFCTFRSDTMTDLAASISFC